MDQTARNWRDDALHLPRFMRDFHDQKDLFKAIHGTYDIKPGSMTDIPWTNAQCYVIDIFLWFMAMHGYTLQKTRKKAEFSDIEKTVKTIRSRDSEAFAKMLSAELSTTHNAPQGGRGRG